MSLIVCKRAGFLLKSFPSSFVVNGSYCSLLLDSATSIPQSLPVLSSSNKLCSTRYRQILHVPQLINVNGKRSFHVDTVALVRKLEAQDLPINQALAITSAINEVLNESFQDNTLLQRENEKLRADMEKIHNELQRENQWLRGDIEKIRSGDINIIRSELKYEIDKVTAGQRLDLNIERGRLRDEITRQKSETAELNSKLDRDIHALRERLETTKLRIDHALKAQLETKKRDLIRYRFCAVLSLSAVGMCIYLLTSQK